MKKTVFLLFVILLYTANTPMFAQKDLLKNSATYEYLASILIPDQQWSPYPSYADRSGWDKLMGENKSAIIARGEKMLNYEWKVIKATDYLAYERTGDRAVMQNSNSANINALSNLVLAELAEGKGRFFDQIVNGVFYQCERTSWVLSAHLPAQRSGRSLPEHTDVVIDLGSGDFGALLAWTYYFFHAEFDKINPAISKRLHDEIYNKIILPYRTEDRYWWMGFKPRTDGLVNNWNPWCNCNVLQCIALLENNPENYARDVYKTMLSVDKFINYVKADGACEEGPSYWGHAAGKLYDYLEVLSLITGQKISLFDNVMIKDMGEYILNSYVGNDWVVNFADASAKFSSDAGLIFRYGKSLKSTDLQQFAAYLVQKKGKKPLAADSDLSDMFRKLESLKSYNELLATTPVFTKKTFTSYPETEFYYFGNHTNNLFLAVKGGYNAESHNHNDVGSFSLWMNETPIFIDAGVGTYTRQTFGPERYSIWTMRSTYHNLPSVNGVEQKFGKEYKAGKVIFNPNKKNISLDIAKAYPDSAHVISWTRYYQLRDNELAIKDSYKLSKTSGANKIHFLVWGNISNTDGRTVIHVDNNAMELLYDKKQFSATLDTIPLPDKRLSNVWGNEIFRLTLIAKRKKTNGTYEYILRKLK